MSIKILLADDHKIMRDGLRVLLQMQSDMEVVAEAETGRAAVRLARKISPDVVIMDINMPDLNGMEAARQIISEASGVKILALSMHSDKRFVMGMLKAGVSGYLLKDCAFDELALAIRTVISHQTYLSPKIAGTVVKDYLDQISQDDETVFSILTGREREVLQLIAEGKSTKEIAFHLNLSVKTIESHRRQIMHKLNIHSTAELTKFALMEGLTCLE
jgi:DNA-binding NarL/FixJ family response regulator